MESTKESDKHMIQIKPKNGDKISCLVNHQLLDRFGIHVGDRVQIQYADGPLTYFGFVAGVTETSYMNLNRISYICTQTHGSSILWFHLDGDHGASYWSNLNCLSIKVLYSSAKTTLKRFTVPQSLEWVKMADVVITTECVEYDKCIPISHYSHENKRFEFKLYKHILAMNSKYFDSLFNGPISKQKTEYSIQQLLDPIGYFPMELLWRFWVIIYEPHQLEIVLKSLNAKELCYLAFLDNAFITCFGLQIVEHLNKYVREHLAYNFNCKQSVSELIQFGELFGWSSVIGQVLLKTSQFFDCLLELKAEESWKAEEFPLLEKELRTWYKERSKEIKIDKKLYFKLRTSEDDEVFSIHNVESWIIEETPNIFCIGHRIAKGYKNQKKSKYIKKHLKQCFP